MNPVKNAGRMSSLGRVQRGSVLVGKGLRKVEKGAGTLGKQAVVVPYASMAPGYPIGSSDMSKSPLDLWMKGIADCEETSCGLVPDGALVLVPFGKQPVKKEDRISALESGTGLSGNMATFVGGCQSKGINMVVDSPVVSGKHARIEGIEEDEGEAKGFGGLFGEKESALKFFLTDLSSLNGTFLNRGRLRPLFPVEIKAGDVLAFGSLENAYRVVKAQARKGFVW